MKFWIGALVTVGLVVQAFRLAAGYVLVDGGDPTRWLAEVLVLIGALSAVMLSGSTGALVFRRSKDPIVVLGVPVLLGIATLLMTAAHLSLMHKETMQAVLELDFLVREIPSVVIALSSALGIDLAILLLSRSVNERPTESSTESVESIEREVEAELLRLSHQEIADDESTGANQQMESDSSRTEDVVAVCEYCKWKTRKPSFLRAQAALRGHWAHCSERPKERVEDAVTRPQLRTTDSSDPRSASAAS